MLSFMRGIGARSGKVVPNNNPVSTQINVLGVGQSLISYLSDNYGGNGEAALLAELQPTYFDVASFNNQAKSGSPMTKAAADTLSRADNWWDETANGGIGGKGPNYTDRIDPIANKNTYQAIVFAQGTADGKSYIAKADYKAALQDFFAQLHSDFPAAKIYLNPFHRRNTGGIAPEPSDESLQAIREAHLETIDELSYVEYGVDFYDDNLADFTHLTSGGNASFGAKIGRRIASDLSARANAGIGPELTNLSLSGSTLSFDIVQNDGGTDWVAPSEFSNLRAEVDETPYNVSAANRVNASSGTFTLDGSPINGSSNLFYTHWGMGAALSNANAGVLKDNASDQALPLKQQILSFLNNNVPSPSPLTRAVAWYKADEVGAISDDGSGNVTSWADKSGNGYDLVQSTIERRPFTGTRMMNGKNVVEFSNAQSLFTSALDFGTSKPAITVFAVWAADTHNTVDGVYGYSDDWATGARVYGLSSGNPSNQFYPTTRYFNGRGICSDLQTVEDNLITLHSYPENGIHQNDELFINGVPQTISHNNPNNGLNFQLSSPQFCLGDYRDGNAAFFDGVIAEVIVFNEILTVSDQNVIGQYLATEWGVSWSDIM